MLRIGMVGEYPTDTISVSNLLNKKYSTIVSFFPLIYDIHGSSLDNPKIKHQLRREFQIEKPDFVVFIRDLDGLEHSVELWELRKSYFSAFNSVIDKRGILLLNIFELEALILTDIEAINSYYGINVDHVDDCMKIESPKEYLKSLIPKYSTGHNPELFSMLQYDLVTKKCRYFKKFDEDFNELIENKN